MESILMYSGKHPLSKRLGVREGLLTHLAHNLLNDLCFGAGVCVFSLPQTQPVHELPPLQRMLPKRLLAFHHISRLELR